MSLTIEEILAADDCKIKKVDTPEWGGDGHVHVRTMTSDRRDQFEEKSLDDTSPKASIRMKGFRARITAYTLCDADGNFLAEEPDKTAEEIGAECSAVVIDRIFSVTSKLNRLTTADIEELVGNSEGAPSGVSGTDSP